MFLLLSISQHGLDVVGTNAGLVWSGSTFCQHMRLPLTAVAAGGHETVAVVFMYLCIYLFDFLSLVAQAAR